MKTRVASLDIWLQTLAGRLIDGEKLLLQSLPGAGKSFVCDQLAQVLGPTAVQVSGRHIGSGTAGDTASAISDTIRATVAREGCAQLLFDDYSRALTSIIGQQLQAMLHGMLVNSDLSEVVGALVLSRWGEKLHVSKAGSPLVSRLDYLPEPEWAPSDLPVGKVPEAVEQEIGRTSGMLALSLGPDGLYDPHRVTRHLDLHVEAVLSACTPMGVQYLAGRRTFDELAPTDREPLLALFAGAGLSAAAIESQLRTTAMSRNRGWPSGVRPSARTFASLLGGEQTAMWVDRFLFKRPADLRRFLIEVRKLTPARLHLLGSNPRWDPIDQEAIRDVSAEISGVECRILTPVQYRKCHDRHMVFLDNSGHVLPVAEVVLGVGEPGTAVATHTPEFPQAYERYWRSAIRL